MVASTFDLFKIGVGPSSSHTMGPMTAAVSFVQVLADDGRLTRTVRVDVALYGSLAPTGKGHATDRAILLGLTGDPIAGPVQIPCIERNQSAASRRSKRPASRCWATVPTASRSTR